jgi:hypothetical protein
LDWLQKSALRDNIDAKNSLIKMSNELNLEDEFSSMTIVWDDSDDSSMKIISAPEDDEEQKQVFH